MRPQSLRSRIVSGFFWLAATKALGQAMSWVITLAVVRLLAPADYGLMGLAVLVNGFLLLFNELGLGAAIIQKPELSDGHRSDLRWVIFLVNAGLFLVLLIVAPAIGRYFHEPSLVGIVRAMAAAFVLNGIGAPSAFVLSREMAFRQKAQAEFLGNLAGSVTTLALALAGWGVWSLVTGYLVLQATSNGLYCFYAPIPLQRPSFAGEVRRSIHFGSQVALGKILWWISSSADAVIVGRVLGTVQLGYYGLAVQFASIPLQKIVSLITQVALPSFAALQHDLKSLGRYYLKFVGTTAFVTFPMFVGLMLVSDSAVRLFLTDKWIAIVVPLKILCVVTCLRAIETLNTPVLLARNRPGIPLFNSFLQAVVLSLAFLTGARWGLNGVAAAWLIAWPALYAVVTVQTLRVLGLPIASYLGALRNPTGGVIAMTAAVLAVGQVIPAGGSPLVRLMLAIVSGAAAYFGYYAVFDRQMLRDVMGTLRIGRVSGATPPADVDAAVTTNV